MSTDKKLSLLVASQLPQFIRDEEEYAKFVSFVEAYYEWMEQEGNVADYTKNLLSYRDIDTTLDRFLNYFINDFLPYFPQDALINKKNAIKIAKTIYDTKGTPASYKFLFRILYNSDFDVFNTGEAILKASSGTWYRSKSLKLLTGDLNFLDTTNLRIFGEDSKAFAVIENVNKIGPKRMEVFISSINRTFHSGEYVKILDVNNRDYLVNGQPLRAKIVGEISAITLPDPNKTGLLYKSGDPVILYGGLSDDATEANSAIAKIGQVYTGFIQRINVLPGKGGYGFGTLSNTAFTIIDGEGESKGAIASVIAVNPSTSSQSRANITYFPTNMIGAAANTTIGNTNYTFLSAHPTANANTSLANSLNFITRYGFPIVSVLVNDGGTGIIPDVSVDVDAVAFGDYGGNSAILKNLGILAPIQIINPGTGYQVNDNIIFTGGSGYAANASVRAVSNTGGITSIYYRSDPSGVYPLGGMGYSPLDLPTLTVQSSNTSAANASIFVPGILGDGAEFSTMVQRSGGIRTIDVVYGGSDYIAAPNVSMRVQDIVVSNVTLINLPEKGDIVYQYTFDNVSAYKATVNSISILETNKLDPLQTKYNLRVFEYLSTTDSTQKLKIKDKDIVMDMVNRSFPKDYFYKDSPAYDKRGIKNFGDGTAKGKAVYLDGVVVGKGRYLDSKGQLSSFDVLQDSVFNNFTYEIIVEKSIQSYKDILLNLLHPSGARAIGKYRMRSNGEIQAHMTSALSQGQTLYYYTNDASANVQMVTDFNQKYTNIMKLNNIGTGTNIATFILPNTFIRLTPTIGPNIYSKITGVDYLSNTVSIEEKTILTFSSVAKVRANASSNTINITELTNTYNIINNGVYSNTAYPLKDIVYIGDRILIPNNTVRTVRNIDFANNTLTVSSPLTANSNGYMTVRRATFVAGGTIDRADQIIFYGPVGVQYFPELATEDGRLLTTEDGRIIILG
jgi:hypothetical protein